MTKKKNQVDLERFINKSNLNKVSPMQRVKVQRMQVIKENGNELGGGGLSPRRKKSSEAGMVTLPNID